MSDKRDRDPESVTVDWNSRQTSDSPTHVVPPEGAAPAPGDAPPSTGTGHYRVGTEIARGGLGRVIIGFDERLQRSVAIKELIARHPDADKRFLREARLTARLQHPSIVPIYDTDHWPDGKPFYAMKLIEGRPFLDVIAQHPTLRERLQLLPTVLAVAEALAYAHDKRIIHRDIKPANVVVGAFGETVVIDWGLAKTLDETEPAAEGPYRSGVGNVTVAGTVVGTPPYMPPEQANGDAVDARADVYALGALLYHTLAGTAPYEGKDTQDVLERVRTGPPIPVEARVAGVPADLAAIVDKAMQRERERRYADAKAFAEDLRRFSTGQLVAAHRYSRATRLVRFVARHRAIVALSAVFALALATLSTLGVRRILRERDRAEARGNETILAVARATLEKNPTATLAWLKEYPLDGSGWDEARSLALEAIGRGVAHGVLWPLDAPSYPAFSPDGKRFATQGATPRIELRDTLTGRVLDTLAETAGAWTLTWSPDGKHIVTNVGSTHLESWNLETRKMQVLAVQGSVNVAYAPDGLHFATGGHQKIVRIFNLDDGTMEALPTMPEAISDLRYTPDGKLVVATAQGEIQVWTLADKTKHVVRVDGVIQDAHLAPDGRRYAVVGEHVTLVDLVTGERRHPPGEDRPGRRAALAPDGGKLAYGGLDSVVRVWDFAKDSVQVLSGHEGLVNELMFSADGKRLATGSRDATIRVWSLASGDCDVLRGHASQVVELRWGPEPDVLISASADESTRVWRLPDARVNGWRAHLGESRTLAWLDDTHVVTTGDEDGYLRVSDVEHGTVREITQVEGGSQVMAVSGDRDVVAIESGPGSAVVWRRSTGKLRTLAVPGVALWPNAVSCDGKHVVTDARDRVVRVWNEDGTFTALDRDSGMTALSAYSPDCSLLLVSGQKGVLRVYDLVHGGAPRVLSGSHGGVTRAAFSADGTTLITAGFEAPEVRFWNLGTGESRVLATLRGETMNLVASADHRFVAVGDFHGDVLLASLDGKTTRMLTGHSAFVHALAFSPDDKWLITGSADRTLRLWDVASGAELAAVAAGETLVSATVMPDGKRALTVDNTGMMRLWRLQPEAPATHDRAALQKWLWSATDVIVRPDRTLASP